MRLMMRVSCVAWGEGSRDCLPCSGQAQAPRAAPLPGRCLHGGRRVFAAHVLRFSANRHQCIAHCFLLQIPGIGKVTEQTLQALGVSTCSDLIRQAALLTALLSDISSSSLIEAGLGLGATEHHAKGGGEGSSQPGRKGISCERTFGAMSTPAEMEAMVGVFSNFPPPPASTPTKWWSTERFCCQRLLK